MKFISQKEKSELLSRFLKYVRIYTTSSSEKADKGIQPSEEREFDLAKILAEEITEIGLTDVQVTEHCYV